MTGGRRVRPAAWGAALALAGALTGCGTTSGGSPAATGSGAIGSAAATAPANAIAPGATTATTPTTPATGPAARAASPTAAAGPSATGPTTAGPGGIAPVTADLAGKVVVLDPGHDGGNAARPDLINRQVDAVTLHKECDTVGAQTAGGYAEHAFNYGMALRVSALLTARGARVVLTRSNDTGVGPCVTDRAAMGHRVHADVAVSIHADGGPVSGYGFHILEPVPVGPNDAIVTPSRRLGAALHDAYHRATGESNSSYAGTDGIALRTDLGGLNLATVPTVFIECANMANPGDAARLATPGWRDHAARGIADGIEAFLTDQPVAR